MGRVKNSKRRPKQKRAPRGTGSVLPDKRRGGWLGKVPVGRYLNGKTKYVEVRGKTLAEVIEKKKLIATPAADVTVAEWADRWLRECSAELPTRDDYAHTVERWIKPTLGARRVADLTAQDVTNAVRSWKLGPNTARKNLRQIVTMLEAARRAKLVTENVAMDARGPKSRKVEINIFTPAELARIIAAASTKKQNTVFALMASVGLRIGEALALDVPDFDGKLGTVSITKTYSRKHGIRRPKSENGIRTVRVPTSALPALRLAIGTRTSGPLFAASHGRGRRQHNTVRANWKVFLRNLELVYRNPHQLRHSCATHSIAAGTHIANVARDLGDSVGVVVRTYCHATAGPGVFEAMEGLLSGGSPASSRP